MKSRSWTSPDGITWAVTVTTPGASNATVHFRREDLGTHRLDRYAWFLARGAEARDVVARLKPADVLQSLTEPQLVELYRKSMPVQTETGGPARSSA